MAVEKLKYIVTADTKGFSGPIKAIAALATAAFVGAVKVTAEFEKELSKLRAITGATEGDMAKLEKKSRDLGKSTAFTAREVASLQTELAKLGFTTNDILNSSGGVLDLAAGLGVELKDAAVLTGSTLRAFGLDTSETGRVVDVLAKSASSSALDFNKLTESLKLAAPIAKLYNISIEDTVALLGTLANAGIHGSLAGTALRQTFLELDKQGISLASAIQQVNNSSNPAATSLELVGKRAAGALAIIAQNQGTVNGLADELRNSEGAAEEMRKIMEDNLIGDFAKLKSAVTELGITIGGTTTGPLRGLTQWFTDFINGTEDHLGFLDSLNKAWLLFKETLLLAGRAAELTYQALIVNNPFGDGIIPIESINRLMMFNEELAKVNQSLLDLMYTSTGGGGSAPSTSSSTPSTTSGTTSPGGTVGAGSGGSSGGGINFGGPGVFTHGWISALGGIKDASAETVKEMKLGWETLAATIGSALGNAIGGDAKFGDIAGGLLKSLGGALISIGVAAVAAGNALSIFGIGFKAIGDGIGAIAIGTILIAGGSLIGKKSGSGGSSSSSASRSQATATTTTPSSNQGDGFGNGRMVAEVDGQKLRFVLQAANDSYTGYN